MLGQIGCVRQRRRWCWGGQEGARGFDDPDLDDYEQIYKKSISVRAYIPLLEPVISQFVF